MSDNYEESVLIAASLSKKDWASVFTSLDPQTLRKLEKALSKKKLEKKNAKTKAPRKSNSKTPKTNKNSKQKNIIHHYRFGKRNLQVLLPKNYPSLSEQKCDVSGRLELHYAHGYSGKFDHSGQNIYISQDDGQLLIYYIASVGVIYNVEQNQQRFFTKHNDDITTICIAPRSVGLYCASGQKDPKDEPGSGGKDLPKIWIWNYRTLKALQLIDDVCWGQITRLQWSFNSRLLYCLCGDADQTLKVYDSRLFGVKKNCLKRGATVDCMIECTTTREKVKGFEINPYSNENIDEIVFYGKRKFWWVGVKENYAKLKSVSISSIKSAGEKSFGCAAWLPDSLYIVGSASGSMYIGFESQCISHIPSAHTSNIGCIVPFGKQLWTCSKDGKLKRWLICSSITKKRKSSNNFSIGKKKPKKNLRLDQKWECEIFVRGSDFVLSPTAMTLNGMTHVIYIGSRTNQIARFNIKDGKCDLIVDGHDGQVWGIAPHPSKILYATGAYDNAIKIWNAKSKKCIFTHEFDVNLVNGKKKITCAQWSPNGEYLVFGSEDSYILVFRCNGNNKNSKNSNKNKKKSAGNNKIQFERVIYIPAKSKNAEIEEVVDLKFSNDSQMLAVAHMDSNLYVYSVYEDWQCWPPMPHIAAPIKSQWNNKGNMVKTFTRDYEVAHWSINAKNKRGKFFAQIPDPNRIRWIGDPLIAGWDVEGLFQHGWDGTDLNDCTLTSDGRFIVSGDDFGTVRLHNYPAINTEQCKAYCSHAEFVVGVKFLFDDSQVISIGGNDMAIFQWKLHRK